MTEKKHSATELKATGGIMGTLLPPDKYLWNEARRLSGDPNLNVDDLATCIAQDPVLVIEFLKIANGMSLGDTKQTITSIKGAIIRLGSQSTIDTLNNLETRPAIENPDVSHWLEIHRSRGKRTAIIARMIAEAHSKNLADECQAAGLLLYIGEMLAVVNLGETYVSIAENNSRTGTIYKLNSEHKFDIDAVGFTYLTRQGIPKIILSAIDRESTIKSQDKMVMKPIVASAHELIEAFDAGKWERFAPGKPVASKSALRLLGIQESQYTKIYERASQYLFLMRQQEEKKRHSLIMENVKLKLEESKKTPEASESLNSSLDDEISKLLDFAPPEESDIFKLSAETKKVEPRKVVHPSTVIPQKIAKLKNVQTIVSSITDILDKATSSEELLAKLLDKLVKDGPFEKTALIVVSKDRSQALVVAARGPNIGNGQKITITDPLSPLGQCFSKVRSYGKHSADVSPFGSNSFALAPIDADHDTPVALYADCGSKSSITFEARRVFRTVVEILNQKLPTLPGGIPVEVEQKR